MLILDNQFSSYLQVKLDLSRGLGKIERVVLEYLDEKAKQSSMTELKTVQSYASTSEIAGKLGIAHDCVCQAVNALWKSGRIKIYPNGRKRNRYFGSVTLPEVSQQEVSSALRGILSTNNS